MLLLIKVSMICKQHLINNLKKEKFVNKLLAFFTLVLPFNVVFNILYVFLVFFYIENDQTINMVTIQLVISANL